MLRLVAFRILGGIATLVAVSILIFVTMEFLPGDAVSAYLGRDATPSAVATLRQEFGLDRPLSVRYLDWIAGVMRGDLGRSAANQVPVTQLVGRRIANSALLVGITLVLLVPLSLAVGTVAALRRGSDQYCDSARALFPRWRFRSLSSESHSSSCSPFCGACCPLSRSTSPSARSSFRRQHSWSCRSRTPRAWSARA